MVISEGLGFLVVPDVVGLAGADAFVVLSDAGLGWVESTEASESVAAGGVIRTEPAAGGSIEAGSPVVVVISQGAGAEDTTSTTAEDTTSTTGESTSTTGESTSTTGESGNEPEETTTTGG